MNQKHLVWTNPYAPVIGDKPSAKRRRRAKLMFQDERAAHQVTDDETAEHEYHDHRGKK